MNREKNRSSRVAIREERVVIERRPGSGRVSIEGEELRDGETIDIPLMRDRPAGAARPNPDGQ